MQIYRACRGEKSGYIAITAAKGKLSYVSDVGAGDPSFIKQLADVLLRQEILENAEQIAVFRYHFPCNVPLKSLAYLSSDYCEVKSTVLSYFTAICIILRNF